MKFEKRYRNAKKKLLDDPAINEYNRNLFAEFFEWEERKLKRINGLAQLDDPSYKTLYDYINRFRNVNAWFKNKPWNELSKNDINQVYNDLEDGVITNCYGRRFEDRRSYYNKIFRYKPFKLAGLKDIVDNTLEFYTDKRKKVVRFICEDGFRRIVSFLQKPQHFALFWLAWDIGENISSLLNLRVRHFKRQINSDTSEPEYLVFLPKDTLKRARKERTEPTIYPETVGYLDALFEYGKEIEYRDEKGRFRRKTIPFQKDDLIFSFEYRQAFQIFNSVVRRSGVKCEPEGDKPSWKDLRSGMACHLFAQGWHVEDINLRLGHSPQSKWLNSYINYLAVKRKRPIKRQYASNIENLRKDLIDSKQKEKAIFRKLERQGQRLEKVQCDYDSLMEGRDFIKLLMALNKRNRQLSETLKNLPNQKFDIILKKE